MHEAGNMKQSEDRTVALDITDQVVGKYPWSSNEINYHQAITVKS